MNNNRDQDKYIAVGCAIASVFLVALLMLITLLDYINVF